MKGDVSFRRLLIHKTWSWKRVFGPHHHSTVWGSNLLLCFLASVRSLRPLDRTGSLGPYLPLTRCPAVQDRLGKERFWSLRLLQQTLKDCPGAPPDHACCLCGLVQDSPILPAGQFRATGGKLVVPLCWDSTAEGLQTALTLGTECGEGSIFRVSRPKQTNKQTNRTSLATKSSN